MGDKAGSDWVAPQNGSGDEDGEDIEYKEENTVKTTSVYLVVRGEGYDDMPEYIKVEIRL